MKTAELGIKRVRQGIVDEDDMDVLNAALLPLFKQPRFYKVFEHLAISARAFLQRISLVIEQGKHFLLKKVRLQGAKKCVILKVGQSVGMIERRGHDRKREGMAISLRCRRCLFKKELEQRFLVKNWHHPFGGEGRPGASLGRRRE